MALKPDDLACYTNLGRSYLAVGRLDSVVLYINKAIAINPNNGFSYVVLAHAYKAANMPDSMNKYEAMARKFDPNFKLN
jgi:tetratricopeptide (TPR) repeat protein